MNREEQDLRGGRYTVNLAGGCETVQARHIDIEKDGVGLQFPHFLDCLLTIFGFTAHFRRVGREKGPNRCSYPLIIVYE
jgi:hypothetical protein